MFTYEQLRRYDTQTLNNMLKNEKDGLKEYESKGEFDHQRASMKLIKKIELVIKEKSRNERV